MNSTPIALAAALVCASALAQAQTPFAFESPKERAQLVQLFTSEGCSSCPPADAFLSALLDRDDLWKRVVPIALHVDYWDYIGWKDPYASPRYTQLQRTYARYRGLENAYTPNFFVDGKEWRGFFRRSDLPPPPTDDAGVLRVSSENGRDVSLRFEPAADLKGNFRAYVAVVGFGAESAVRAGENNGRTLTHDFVALSLSSARLERYNGNYEATLRIDTSNLATAGRYGIVAWISRPRAPIPVQATGGFLE